jgi:hypothetical protein
MAQRECPNCSAILEARIDVCPACGFPLPESSSDPTSKLPGRWRKPQASPMPHPPKPGPHGLITGVARGVQLRSRSMAQGSTDILTFRIEQFDASGNRVESIPVEVKGLIKGILTEGDTVEIAGKWRSGTTLRPRRIRNRTTGGTVEVSRGCLKALILFIVMAVVVVLAVVVGGRIVLQYLMHH